MDHFYKKLNKITKYINSSKFIYNVKNKDDGRICSLLNEEIVIRKITTKFPFTYASTNRRELGDFYIKHYNNHYPVNLKLISKNNKSYNNIVGLPRVMKHLFFEDKKLSISYEGITKGIINNNFSDKINDYGLLVIQKETGNCDCSSLLKLKKVNSNPTNGFQFKELNSIERTPLESREFIITNFKEVLRKRAHPYLLFEKENKRKK
jgi:hypothetical protein